jgi:hypothetical protein
MEKKRIKLFQKFSEQYTMFIDTDLYGVNLTMKTKMKLRWDFTILDIREEDVEIKLLLLDHHLIFTDNPMVKESAALTKIFSRLYNELHLVIDQTGTVKKILNLPIILGKWQDVKKEMLEISERNPDIKNAVQLHDSIFNDETKLIQGIQYGEFFMIYFNKFFGKDLPRTEQLVLPNFFKTANVNWKYNFETSKDHSFQNTNLMITLNGIPSTPLGAGFYQRAYGQFSNIKNISNLSTLLEETGKYEIEEETGRIIQAKVSKSEIADEDLYMKMTYILVNDQVLKEKLRRDLDISVSENISSE